MKETCGLLVPRKVKNADIQKDPKVTVTFQNNSKWEYVVVNGTAEILQDSAHTEKFGTSILKLGLMARKIHELALLKLNVKTAITGKHKMENLYLQRKLCFQL